MDLLFHKVLYTNRRELYQYLGVDDHKKLANAFMDKYIHFLLDDLDDLNYRKAFPNPNFDHIIKMVLESIKIHRLKSTTLNRLNRGFWNHISLYCRLKEKFIYKWSHKINMFRLKVNSNFRFQVKWYGEFLPRKFSKKFYSIFPGMKDYKPCVRCFDDTDHHYKPYLIQYGWICQECEEKDRATWYDDDYLSDRHWSVDDSDYDDGEW